MNAALRIKTTMALAAAFSAAATPNASAQCQYEVTAIIEGPECFFGPAPVLPTAMNDHGAVVGYWLDCFETDEHPFVWTQQDGLVELDLPVPNVVSARVTDINNHGDICGWFFASDDDTGARTFVLTADGTFIEIPVPPGGNKIEAHAINDAGQVVGWWGNIVTGMPTGAAAFLWDAGTFKTILPIDEFDSSRARNINGEGHVVGEVRVTQRDEKKAFLWRSGNVTILPAVPPNGFDSDGRAVNDGAFIVGGGVLPLADDEGTITRAFSWCEPFMNNLGALPEFRRSAALDVHDNRLAIGYCWQSEVNPNDRTVTLWHFNDIIDVQDGFTSPTELNLQYAVSVTAGGQILVAANGPSLEAFAAILSPLAPPRADITGDCAVNVYDVLTLIEHWSARDSFADVNGDGVVDIFDLFDMLANWGP